MPPAFVHGALAWAAIVLVAIPVIIHFWNRRRFRRIDWAAMEFLLQALRKNRRRIRLEGLLLLLVRAASMALLAFFLARPLVSEQGLEWLGSAFRGEEKVFILDDSFSMTRRDGGHTAFQRATRALAAQVDRLAEPGARDRLTVVRSSRPDSPLLKGAILDRDRAAAFGQSIERLSPTDRRLALAEVLAALAVSAGREESEGAARARAILILTDLRAADWTDGRGGPDAALAEALRRLAGGEEARARIAVLDVGTEDKANVAITEAAVEGGDPIAEIPAEIRAVVRNFGPSPARGLSLRVRYGPAPQPSEEGSAAATPGPAIESLAPGASEEVRIPCTFRKTGHYGVTVEVLGSLDAAPGRRLLPARRPGGPRDSRPPRERRALLRALRRGDRFPGGGAGRPGRGPVGSGAGMWSSRRASRPGISTATPRSSSPTGMPCRRRRRQRSPATPAVAGPSSSSPADQLDAGLWNRRFASRPPAAGAAPAAEPSPPFLPARLVAIEEAGGEPWRLAFAFDHPFFRELRDAADLLATARFEKRFALEPVPGAQVLARFSDAAGSAAIVERAWGKGRVVLFASAADLEWSDWPRNPSYLMALHELLRGLLASRAPRAPALAGSRARGPVRPRHAMRRRRGCAPPAIRRSPTGA